MGKAASDYLKTKLRIRWYTPADSTDTALKPSGRFLEVKHKIGSTRQKHRLSLSEQFETFNAKQPSLTSKQREELRHALQQIEPALLAMQLDPSLTVSYQRQRYYDPFSQTRIALDSNIVCQSASRQLTMANSRIKLDKAVLETKGTQRRLPTCLRGAGLAMIEKTAFSKYYESYKLLSHYEQ